MNFEEIGYESVIESHIKIFMYLASKYLRTINGFDRDDLIHEQKIACYQAMINFDPSKASGAFIYAVAENRLKSIYRYESRQKRRPDQILYIESANFEQAGLFLSDGLSSPEEKYYITELKLSIVEMATQVLSPFEYKLFTMTLAGDKTILEMATVLSKNEKQITSGITRMRRKMREKRKSDLNDL